MIDQIFEDINKALDAEAYIAALALALTLPDLCGKIEYPEEKSSRKRYIMWYDLYMGTPPKSFMLERLTDQDDERFPPYLTGQVLYQLRCNLLHESMPNVDKENVLDENKEIETTWNVDEFVLIAEKKNDFDMYAHCSSVHWDNFSTSDFRKYELSVRKICADLIYVTTKYFEKNPDKKHNIKFTLINKPNRKTNF